jgi:exodeoxyribonuclease V alpha subunit
VWLALARVLAAFRDQHTCVDLGEHADWLAELRACLALVGGPGDAVNGSRTPFVLDEWSGGATLYLRRAWSEEQFVADALLSSDATRLKVITGGPGTGKTTKVVTDLVKRLADEIDSTFMVALAAPTGKAAKRMTQAIEAALDKAEASADIRKLVLASPARTIHRLLGAAPGRREHRYTYHADNRLPHDLVIVDETSMVSLSQMYHLLSALKPETELILVGDPDQLASVEAGTVLADIVDGFGTDRVTVLTEQHRFKDAKGIIDLASAIRDGDIEHVMRYVKEGGKGVKWIDPMESPELVRNLVDEVVDNAREVIEFARAEKLPEALAKKGTLQVLCAHRHGKHGVTGWNRLVEEQLGVATSNPWYAGRPVIVTVNDNTTGLYNGDVGIIGQGTKGRVAHFGSGQSALTLPTTRLPHVDTVHALTIHKSQGSEYDHVIVVLPEQGSRILTRELFYTGVTRASAKLTILGTKQSIEAAVATKVRRATGLARRLRS